MDEKDTIDSYTMTWFGKNQWFNPCSSEYNSKLCFSVMNHSHDIEERFHKEGKAALIMNSKEYFDEIDRYVLSLEKGDQSTEYEIEMKMVGRADVDEIINGAETLKEDGVAKVAEALTSTKYNRSKLYKVDGQIVLFKLEAPEGWEYFLGREEECWSQRNEKTKCYEEKRKSDPQRMHELKVGGWTVVPADRYPELEYFHVDGALKYKGLVLLERPKSIGDKARARLDTLNANLPNFGPVRQDIIKEIDYEFPKYIKQSRRVEYEEKKSLLKRFISFFKRKERHYYAPRNTVHGSLLFPKTRRFAEILQFKFRFGKYKLDDEEKEVCKGLDITEESYIQEKYKVEMDSIY